MLGVQWPGRVLWGSGGCSRLARLGPLAVGLAAAYAIYRLRQRERRRQRRLRWDGAGHNVVVLHQFARAAVSPNLSPFALKLETLLRMAGVRYVVDTSAPLGPKGKCPWITLNGRDVTDSELIMVHLLEVFPDALAGLCAPTPAQRALGRAVQVALDEHLIVAVAAHRFVVARLCHLVAAMAPRYRRKFRLLRPLVALAAAARLRRVGWADYGRDGVETFIRRDLTMLADLLGERPYLLGEQATEYDAAVFGQLTQVLTGCAPEVHAIARQFPNLVAYFERMKERYWPDWEQCVSP